MTIQVTTSGDVPLLGIRPEPTLEAKRKFQLQSGEKMVILDGPECSNDSYFWYVHTPQGKGWVREGNDRFYFVDPLSSSANINPPSLTSTNESPNPNVQDGTPDYMRALYAYFDAKNNEDVQMEMFLTDLSTKSPKEIDDMKDYLNWYYETYDVKYKIKHEKESQIFNDEDTYVQIDLQYQFSGRDPVSNIRLYELRRQNGQWKVVGLAKLFHGSPPTPTLIEPVNESVISQNPIYLIWTNPHDETKAKRIPQTKGFFVDSNESSLWHFVVDVWAYDPSTSDWVSVRNWIESDIETQVWFDDTELGLPSGYTKFAWQVQYVNVLYEKAESEWSEWFYFEKQLVIP